MEARNPDGMGISLDRGMRWGHTVSVMKRARSFSMLQTEWARMANLVRNRANAAELEGHLATALQNYFLSSLYYCSAQWSIWKYSDDLEKYHRLKNDCYDKVIELNDYPIERVEIPFEGSTLPGLLHLPLNHGQFPVVVFIPGMDQAKEEAVNIFNNRFVKRGIACLVIDGPGQGESLALRRIHVGQDSFEKAGKNTMDFLLKHENVNPNKIALFGNSMGSYWASRIAASDERYRACAVKSACVEDGMNTIFNQSYPSFRYRFMYMAGIEDEREFDKFAEKMTLREILGKVKCPFLFLAGKNDQLCPIEHVRSVYDRISSPKLFLVYEGEFHPLGKVYGEVFDFAADWFLDRFTGKTMENEWREVPIV